MASVFSHPAVALGLGPLFASNGVEPRVWALGAACAVLPDIDVIGFHYGVPYGNLFGHRGLAFGRGVRFANRRPRVLSHTELMGALPREAPSFPRLAPPVTPK